MGRLIRMDFYRLVKSKLFIISLIVLFSLQLAIAFGIPILTDMIAHSFGNSEEFKMDTVVKVSSILSNPMMSFFMIIMFISAISFLFADIRNGYIKNIAGQISKKGYTAISKFIVVCFHNFVFMVVSVLGTLIGSAVCPKTYLSFDNAVFSGLVIFLVKVLLSFAMIAIILFITTGLRNKTIASVIGVLFSLGALGLLYAGLDQLLSTIGIKNVNVENYIPDQLYNQSYDVAAFSAVINSVIVSVIFIVVFLSLTVMIFNKRDVK